MTCLIMQDDFSWGETRKIVGAGKDGHGDKEDAGLFDSSSIVMRRWIDFERDRRYRSGMQSRDSTYDVLYRSGSPQRSASPRNSIISSADTYLSGGGTSNQTGEPLFRQHSPSMPGGSLYTSDSDVGHLARHPTHLELPAPLATTSYDNEQHSLPRPPLPVYHPYEYDSEDERDAILSSSPQTDTPLSFSPPYPSSSSNNMSLRSDPYLTPTLPTQQAFRESHFSSPPPPVARPFAANSAQRSPRGVSLVDPGPVATNDGGSMRVAQRHSRVVSTGRTRQTSSDLSSLANNSNAPSPTASLPPGAAPSRFSSSHR